MAACPTLLNYKIHMGHGQRRNPSSNRSIGVLDDHCSCIANLPPESDTSTDRPPHQRHICQKSYIEHVETSRSSTVWRRGVPLKTKSTPAVLLWQDGQARTSWIMRTSIGIGLSERPIAHWEDACMVGHHAGFTLIERAKEGLNSVAASEWILIDVIADSGACETVMPKGLCPNISL